MAAAKAKANGGRLAQELEEAEPEPEGPSVTEGPQEGPQEAQEGGAPVEDPKKPSGPSMKGKTVTNWLNHTLGQATHKLDSGVVASAAAKQAQAHSRGLRSDNESICERRGNGFSLFG